jgi:hypothetical protein
MKKLKSPFGGLRLRGDNYRVFFAHKGGNHHRKYWRPQPPRRLPPSGAEQRPNAYRTITEQKLDRYLMAAIPLAPANSKPPGLGMVSLR